ncbi:hypothetical protein ACSSV9_14110 [Melioribacter sp. OK-6-Me]|uniref:hypothetical protein n=1 Tax=Melioribacter sp. OK-6-Me TaxID=3423433 RepID=UPI003EDAA8E1
MDTDAYSIYDEQNKRINEDKSIIISNHVWIGCQTLILKKAEIGDGCIVGANSLTNKKFIYNEVVLAGNPEKLVKKNVKW